MDSAFHTQQGRTYYALEFSQLTATEIKSLRYSFICSACRRPAYFRKAASSGQGPCFGAKHTEECEAATRVERDPWDEPSDDLVQKLEADETRILLNLGGVGAFGDAGVASDSDTDSRRGHRFGGSGEALRSQIQRNPEKLLRLLVEAPTFRTSALLISGPRGEIPVHQFFVAMNVASRDRHAASFHGFWGIPRWTNVWNGLRLFNGAAAPSLGFEISNSLVTQIMEKYRLDEITDLRSRYVMFLGSPRITTNDSFMMDVPSLAHVAVLPSSFC